MKYENFDKACVLYKQIRELKQLKYDLEVDRKSKKFGIMISAGALEVQRLSFIVQVFINDETKTEQQDGFEEMGQAFIESLCSKLDSKIYYLTEDLRKL